MLRRLGLERRVLREQLEEVRGLRVQLRVRDRVHAIVLAHESGLMDEDPDRR